MVLARWYWYSFFSYTTSTMCVQVVQSYYMQNRRSPMMKFNLQKGIATYVNVGNLIAYSCTYPTTYLSIIHIIRVSIRYCDDDDVDDDVSIMLVLLIAICVWSSNAVWWKLYSSGICHRIADVARLEVYINWTNLAFTRFVRVSYLQRFFFFIFFFFGISNEPWTSSLTDFMFLKIN